MTRTTTTHARGYTRVHEHYGIGYPGWSVTITRDSDGARMWAGPGTDVEAGPYRHPEWIAMPGEERRAIVAALRQGE